MLRGTLFHWIVVFGPGSTVGLKDVERNTVPLDCGSGMEGQLVSKMMEDILFHWIVV